MVAFPGPHDPYNPPRDWAERFDPAAMPQALPRNADTDRFRDELIKGHAGGSSRIDLSSFPEADQRRVRAHYSALIALIDQAVGDILDALARRPDADRTIVVLAADHGDFVGDFEFLGKDLFFQPAMRVPLILRLPQGGQGGQRSKDLVTVTDLFATFLAVAGVPNRTGLDSHALPPLAPPGAAPRRRALGAVGRGFALEADGWRLARYGNGLATLYDLAADPEERRNLIEAEAAQPVRERLDAALAAELLRASKGAHRDQRYPYLTMTPGHPGHQRGWRRPYPWPGEG
jgi:arylsulfatase A-like enzyme